MPSRILRSSLSTLLSIVSLIFSAAGKWATFSHSRRRAQEPFKHTVSKKDGRPLSIESALVHRHTNSLNLPTVTLIGFTSESLLHKMRLLTLATLGCENATISFATLSSELKVDVADVDMWVFEAIKEGYIDAKIDEVESAVIIRCVMFSHRKIFS